MRLYHHPFSSNARKAVMTALVLGIDLELVVVDLTNGEQRSPEYLKKNPNGKVPVLEDGDFVLWESNAIMAYLADRTPGQTLYPTDLRARADVNRWLFWGAYHFVPLVATLNFENMVKRMMGAGEPDPAIVERTTASMRELAGILDAHLDGRTWVSGDALTLADLSLAAPLMWTHPSKLPVTDRPHLQAWYARVQELDAWKRTGGGA